MKILVTLLVLFVFALGLKAENSLLQKDTLLAAKLLQSADSSKEAENYDLAIKKYLESAALYEKHNLQEKNANIFHYIGKIYRLSGNYDKALEYDLKSLKINEATDNEKFIALNLNNVGIDFHRMLNFEKALEYLDKSLKMRIELGDSIGIADSYINLGMVYDESGEAEKGLEYYERGLEYYEKIDELDGMAVAFNNIAGIYYQKGDLDNVLRYALQSLEIRRKLGSKYDISFNLIHIGLVYSAQNLNKEAISFIQEGLDMAEEIGAKSQIKLGYESLSSVYASMNDYEKAYESFIRFNAINDSIFKEKSARAIAEMQTKYETEKKVQENEILKRDISLQKAGKRIYLIFLIGLILIVGGLFFLFRLRTVSLKQSKKLLIQEKELNKLEIDKNDAEKKRLEDNIFAEKQLNRLQREKFVAEIEHKNKELANSALCIINKNEILTRIKGEIQSKPPANEAGEFIPGLISMINQNIDIDQNWQMFKLKFEEIHPGFFSRLQGVFPGLSDSQVRLCAYVRIGITSTEIAQLENVTIAAVKKSRQRLRKKLELMPETELLESLEKV